MEIAGIALASVALAIAILALLPAFKSLSVANRSLSVANESLVAAHQAVELARADIDNSHHDVTWGMEPGNGSLVFTNLSHGSTAREVRIDAEIDGEERKQSFDHVGPRGSATIDFPGAIATFDSELRRLREIEDSEPHVGLTMAFSDQVLDAREEWARTLNEHRLAMMQHQVMFNIRWQTQYQIPKLQTDSTAGMLGDIS